MIEQTSVTEPATLTEEEQRQAVFDQSKHFPLDPSFALSDSYREAWERGAVRRAQSEPPPRPAVPQRLGISHAERIRLVKINTLNSIREIRPTANQRSHAQWERGSAETVPVDAAWNWWMTHSDEHFHLTFLPELRTQAGQDVDALSQSIKEAGRKKCTVLLWQTRDEFFATAGTSGHDLRQAEERLRIEQEFEQTYNAELEQLNIVFKQQCGSGCDDAADVTEAAITRLKRQVERCQARQGAARQSIAALRPKAGEDLAQLLAETREHFIQEHEAREKELHRKLAEQIGSLLMEYHKISCEIHSAIIEHQLMADGVPMRRLLSVDAEPTAAGV